MKDFNIFMLGGFASIGATVFTNPFEVIKTRMQLQGELAARGTYVEPYRNVFHAFVTVAKHDGMKGLQKGLSAAVGFQFIINSVRLTIYDAAVIRGLTKTKSGKESFLKCGFYGGVGGIIGSALSNPFFLLKTQFQAQSAESIAVGYQHKHEGLIQAMRTIVKRDGLKGLYRSVFITIPRGFLGSGGQLAGFGYSKDLLKRHNIATNSPLLLTFTSGVIAGTVMAIAITPPDVIATRLYNQGIDKSGKGMYYSGVWDCFWKISKTEGLYGLYKGFWAQYLRIGPHATLVLFFFDTGRNYFNL